MKITETHNYTLELNKGEFNALRRLLGSLSSDDIARILKEEVGNSSDKLLTAMYYRMDEVSQC